MYLSGIAGYASGASRLHKHPIQVLEEAKAFLAKPFFEKYPNLGHFKRLITPTATPDLFHRMEEAELDRAELVQIVDGLLSP